MKQQIEWPNDQTNFQPNGKTWCFWNAARIHIANWLSLVCSSLYLVHHPLFWCENHSKQSTLKWTLFYVQVNSLPFRLFCALLLFVVSLLLGESALNSSMCIWTQFYHLFLCCRILLQSSMTMQKRERENAWAHATTADDDVAVVLSSTLFVHKRSLFSAFYFDLLCTQHETITMAPAKQAAITTIHNKWERTMSKSIIYYVNSLDRHKTTRSA